MVAVAERGGLLLPLGVLRNGYDGNLLSLGPIAPKQTIRGGRILLNIRLENAFGLVVGV